MSYINNIKKNDTDYPIQDSRIAELSEATEGQILAVTSDKKIVPIDAPQSGVVSFNGRSGVVVPAEGDYTAAMVGADASGTASAAVSALESALTAGTTVVGKAAADASGNNIVSTYGTKAEVSAVEAIAKGAQKALSFASYSALITDLNVAPSNKYNVGQSIYVETKDVPDMWISKRESSAVTYIYVSDAQFVADTAVSGGAQVGYYKICQLETQKVDISGKADKVASAVSGNFAGLDASGNLTDSGSKAADFLATAENSGSVGQILTKTATGQNWQDAPASAPVTTNLLKGDGAGGMAEASAGTDYASAVHTHTAAQVSGLASVATTGSYADLSNKPTIPASTSAAGTATRPVYMSSADVATACSYGFGIDATGPYIESF